MDFEAFFTMDIVNIVLEDLVLVELDLMRELVTLRIRKQWDSNRLLFSVNSATISPIKDSMNIVLLLLP